MGSDIPSDEFAVMKRDIGDIKSLMGKLVDVVSRFALLEERQQSTAEVTNKILERVERIENHQHQMDVRNARTSDHSERIKNLEVAFREVHIDSERHKTRMQTSVWMMRGAWAVIGSFLAAWAYGTFIGGAGLSIAGV